MGSAELELLVLETGRDNRLIGERGDHLKVPSFSCMRWKLLIRSIVFFIVFCSYRAESSLSPKGLEPAVKSQLLIFLGCIEKISFPLIYFACTTFVNAVEWNCINSTITEVREVQKGSECVLGL